MGWYNNGWLENLATAHTTSAKLTKKIENLNQHWLLFYILTYPTPVAA